MKESFLIYKSFYEPIKGLSINDKGLLLDAIFEYQINGNEPDKLTSIYMPFMFFKNQFRLDNKKYEKIVERNKVNGAKGGRPKGTNKQNKPSGLINNPNNPSEPKKPDNDNDNEKDNVNKGIPAYSDFMMYAYSKKPNIDENSLKLKYDAWCENGWKDGNDKLIKNWKSKLLNTIPFLNEKTKENINGNDRFEWINHPVYGKIEQLKK